MMTAFSTWRDSDTGAWNLDPNVKGRGLDNGILTSAVACRLNLISAGELFSVVMKYWDGNLGLRRYPGSTDFCSDDDYIGGASASPTVATLFADFLERRGWAVGPSRDPIWRFPLCPTAVKSGEGQWLWPTDWIAASGAYLLDLCQPKDSTSGRQLLWMAAPKIHANSLAMRPAINLWLGQMAKVYPGGPREMLSIYYTNPDHPFRSAAPTQWGIEKNYNEACTPREEG